MKLERSYGAVGQKRGSVQRCAIANIVPYRGDLTSLGVRDAELAASQGCSEVIQMFDSSSNKDSDGEASL